MAGVAVGIHSGRPTLQLADFVVAIRAYQSDSNNGGYVGCTINPRADGLQKLRQFQRKIPKVVSDRQRNQVSRFVATGVRDSLGMAEVQVFGISPDTHFAQVMIEADYRMKRIAVGVENPPIRMPTFASAMTTARHGDLQRWWFTPNYDGVLTSPDRLAMRMSGQGVQLQTENKDILPSGAIANGGKPTKAATTFATSFTQKYNDIASASAVYAQLRQMIDHLIVAAYFQKHDWYRIAKWNTSLFLDESKFNVNQHNNPQHAPVVVNVFWKQRRMFAPAGGGVSIVAAKALEQMVEDKELAEARDQNRPNNVQTWWWD